MSKLLDEAKKIAANASASVEDADGDGDADFVVRAGGVVVYQIDVGALLANAAAEWRRVRQRVKKARAKRAK